MLVGEVVLRYQAHAENYYAAPVVAETSDTPSLLPGEVARLRCDRIPTVIQSSRRYIMTKTDMIRARVEPKLKSDAEKILDSLGMTASDAIRIFYKQVVLRKGLPFDVMIPNAETRRAIEDDKKGRMTEYKDSKDMRKKLGL